MADGAPITTHAHVDAQVASQLAAWRSLWDLLLGCPPVESDGGA